MGIGLNTKVDPKQLPIGRFLALNNAVFGTDGLLKKRNGYTRLPTLPDMSATTLTTFNGSLTAIGTSLQNYSPDTKTWYDKGTIYPVTLSVIPTVRSATNQSQEDTAVAPNGLACTVWKDSDGNSKYSIVDTTSNQVVVGAVNLPSTATVARVFVLGRFFIITFLATVSASTHLQYIAIPLINPLGPGTATDLATNPSALTTGYDGVVSNNNLYFAYGASGPTLKFSFLDSTLIQHGTTTVASRNPLRVSLSSDTSTPTPTIWVTFYDSNSNLYTCSFSGTGVAILAPTVIVNTSQLANVTSYANNGVVTVFYQLAQLYSFSLAETDSIVKNTVTSSGTVGSPTVILRSVGLASKAFVLDDTIYMLTAYGSNDAHNQNFQPTYFLIDENGHILAKLAYSNGGGYPSNQVLPQANVDGNVIKIAYQFKDLLTSVNKAQGVADTAGIYSQTGLNLATFVIGTDPQIPAEIAASLHLTGGFLWQYDGAKPVEHSFHVWPEDVGVTFGAASANVTQQQYFYRVTYEWTDAQGILHRSAPSIPTAYMILAAPSTFTADTEDTGETLHNVSSLIGLQVGQLISGSGIQAGTRITSIVDATTITISLPATISASAVTLTPTTLTSIEIDVPTLRLTYKTDPNEVRIVIYRWSTAQQNYYQITSVQTPLLNDTTTDSVTYLDLQPDSQILGNQLLYTTGGVVENIAAPACTDVSLYKTRLFVIDAEDENLIWYSKQVIEQTPVEMNDGFTLYLPPTIGAQGSTGKVKVIAPMDDKNIFFKPNAIYYNTGTGPDNTGANNDFSDPQFISSNVGCSNPNSIVLQPMGLMFQSDKGIWLLDRSLNTKYIGADVQAFNDDVVKSATAIPGTTQVRFTMESGSTLMFDYYYNQWGVFTRVPSISSTLYGGLHTFLNKFGQVYQESPDLYLDGTNPVLLSFQTGWISLAGIQGYERFYQLFFLGEYLTPFKLNVQLAYDFNGAAQQNVTVLPDAPQAAYGSEPGPYGSGSPYGGPGTQFKARLFPTKQKCETFQVTVTEIYDPQYGIAAGAGLTLSALMPLVGIKKGSRTTSARRSFG